MAGRKEDFIQPVRPGKKDAQRRPPTRWPGPGERLVLHPAEKEVLFYRTHYVGDRTRPCLGPMCACNRLDVPINTRLTGWVLAWEPYGKLVLAQVTLNAYETCPDLQDPALDLRTCELVLTRAGRRPNGPVHAKVTRDHHTADKYPPIPFSQRDQLMRVWFRPMDDYEEVNQVAEVLHQLGNRDPSFVPLKAGKNDEGGAQ